MQIEIKRIYCATKYTTPEIYIYIYIQVSAYVKASSYTLCNLPGECAVIQLLDKKLES